MICITTVDGVERRGGCRKNHRGPARPAHLELKGRTENRNVNHLLNHREPPVSQVHVVGKTLRYHNHGAQILSLTSCSWTFRWIISAPRGTTELSINGPTCLIVLGMPVRLDEDRCLCIHTYLGVNARGFVPASRNWEGRGVYWYYV